MLEASQGRWASGESLGSTRALALFFVMDICRAKKWLGFKREEKPKKGMPPPHATIRPRGVVPHVG